MDWQARLKKKAIFVDQFEKIQFQSPHIIDRSIWISALTQNQLQNPERIWKFFQKDYECGLIRNVTVKQGTKIPGKPAANIYAIIEYAHVNSIARSLKVASKKQSIIDGNRFRIYKCGTRTVVFVRPSRKK